MNNDLPVIFMAFANEKENGARYLRGLAVEQRNLQEALERAVDKGLCELIVESNATLDTIINTFQKERYRDRIAVFHYGGHADGYQLLLETAENSNAVAHGEGLVSFLSGQKGLRFIFLNGCSTQQQAEELTKAGIPAVIGTSQSIADDVATELGARFYRNLGQGNTLARSWKEAQDYFRIHKGSANTRSLYFFVEEQQAAVPDRFPWDIYYREGSEIVKEWNLPVAGNNPLFGLPEIPESYQLPEKPFRYLKRYTSKDARVFFGRSQFIKNLFTRVNDDQGTPIILFHGQSGAGKSSCLDSGLLPRIEQSHTVISLRRNQELGLLGTLQEGLGVASREMNLVQLKKIAHEFGEEAQARFEQFISQLAESRDEETGKLHFSEQELEKFREVGSLLPVWKSIEEKTGKPLIVILDQVEEMYTRPMPEILSDTPFANSPEGEKNPQRAERTMFLSALVRLFGDEEDRPRGKLILSYRKEFHSEIEENLKKAELPREALFLEHLSQKNIVEIIEAFEQRPFLRKAYNIQLEEDLSRDIARDLTRVPDSPVAPVLQIILSRLWDLAVKENPEEPVFTRKLYNRIIDDGVEMRDFFLQQMRHLKSMKHELQPMVESGLALDLLKFHVTELGTAGTRRMEKILDRYRDHEAVITHLVHDCADLSLLASIDGDEMTMLAHDTLAPVVEQEYNESDLPAQRASRIIAAKMTDYRALTRRGAMGEAEKVHIDEEDLEVVERGLAFMRSLDDDERALLERSRKITAQEKRQRQRARRLQLATLIALVIGAVIFGVYQQQAKKNIYEANYQRVKRNNERAREAMRRLNYPEAFTLLDEAAQLGIEKERTLLGLNELAFAYLQVVQLDTNRRVFEFLESAQQVLEGNDRQEMEGRIQAARQAWEGQDQWSFPMYATLDSARRLISSQEEDDRLVAKYYPEMVDVTGGEFEMGIPYSPDPELQDAIPAHTVAVSDFSISKYEVTVAQYFLFAMSENPNNEYKPFGMPDPPASDWLAELPIVAVTYYDATNYCDWLGGILGSNYRLPREAEWEYAAKGGQQSAGFRYSGSDSVKAVAWIKGMTNFARPGGQLRPNELGIHDMSGNVKEWCYDLYDPLHYRKRAYSGLPVMDPFGPDERDLDQDRGFVVRGGGYADSEKLTATDFRNARSVLDDGITLYSDIVLGIRVVSVPAPPQEELMEEPLAEGIQP